MAFNPIYFINQKELNKLTDLLNEFHVGDGVLKTYVPDWLSGPGSNPPPSHPDDEDKYWFHLDFVNGAKGFTAGLILDRLKRYPYSQQYVLKSVHEETINQISSPW